MKAKYLSLPSLALLGHLVSCSVPYSPGKVQAVTPPYQSRVELDHVKRLEKKGIVAESWLGREGDICAIHAMKMEVITIPGMDGEILPALPYSEARSRYFPNDGIQHPPELYSQTRLGKIHVCPKYVEAARAWATAEKAGKSP